MRGVPNARDLLIDAPSHWPPVELAIGPDSDDAPGAESVTESEATLRLGSGGWVTVDRAARRATFVMDSPPSADALVHPHLAPVAMVEARWNHRESFHAGGFVAGEGVWGLLGVKGAGKSTLLASLAASGVPVMCDDVLVIDTGTAVAMAMAGPRSIDLREGAAQQLRSGTALGVIGLRERWRLVLDPVAAELPLQGWVSLSWGETVTVEVKRGSERLRALLPHRGLRLLPTRPEKLIDLAGLPVLELSRPPDWDSHQQAIEILLDAVAAAGEPGRLQQGE